MLLSIVTGTYNRLEYLKDMMASVRLQLPRHIDYEFVVVDGGSTDGTLEWLHTLEGVTVIEHGELRGAITAFCDGARAARGEYVIMANDDVTFFPNSIMRALAYIEDRPTCGAVAFADNRSAKVGKAKGYRVEKAPAIAPDGQQVMVNYAQVGLIRRWIGELVGWWGDRDEIMQNSRTYGGDNFLSSGIWGLGYTVDAVAGCQIEDLIARDTLRQSNVNGSNDSKVYYTRYPRGPQIPVKPLVPNTQHQHLRILALPIYEPNFPANMNKEYGLTEAFARVGLTWEVDYVNEEYDLVALADIWKPHLLFLQMHDAKRITANMLQAARQRNPGMAIVNWNGDAHLSGLVSEDMIEVLREVDLQTVVNAAVLPVYKTYDINAAYWQIGLKDPSVPFDGEALAHDVLFLGNCYNEEREQLAATLSSLKGVNVGLYGNCPRSIGNTHYDFGKSRALYENCKIAISDTFPGSIGYVSNRLFQAMAAGAFVLQQHSPRLDEYNGFEAGVHYVEWHSLADLQKKVKRWLRPTLEAKRRQIAAQGQKFVRDNFNYDAQVAKLWDLLP